MQIVTNKITVEKLKKMSDKMFNNLVKAVVDIEQEIMVVDAELHSDEEEFLLENGSKQENLWGINIHPHKPVGGWVEFDSMINIRPAVGNKSHGVENPVLQKKIKTIVTKLVQV